MSEYDGQECGYLPKVMGNKDGSTIFETCRLQGTGKCPLDGELPRSERMPLPKGETYERFFGQVMGFVHKIIIPLRRTQCRNLKNTQS